MKKILVVMFLVYSTVTATTFAQQQKGTVEVLYFKTNLACCKARACNALEGKVIEVVDKNWTDGSVTFRQVKLSDSTNTDLVKKYNARSQSLILIKTNKKKKASLDISAILQEYAKTNDTQKFETEFTAKINEFIKQK